MKRVVVLGDVIEDIIVISDSARQLNTDNPANISSKPGGSGANFAVWLASLGVEVELVARVADLGSGLLVKHRCLLVLTKKLEAVIETNASQKVTTVIS